MALSIKEIQIGDFVMYNGCFASVYCVQSPLPRRDRLSDKNVITLFLNGLIDASEDEIEPIPLTQEILEKNGFAKYQQKESCPYYYIQRISLRYHVHGEYFYIDTDVADIRFVFVHELQHALRLCGLNDLADNLKI